MITSDCCSAVVVLHFAADRDDGHNFPCDAQEEEPVDFLARLPPLDHVLLVVDRSQMGPRWFRYVTVATQISSTKKSNQQFL